MTHVRRGILDGFIEPLLALNALLAYSFLYLPIAVLVLFSFSASRYASIWGGFSEWYAKPFHNPDIAQALLNSLLIAAATTLIRHGSRHPGSLGAGACCHRGRASHF
jgi:spermidine/putrescine transport system permease protein